MDPYKVGRNRAWYPCRARWRNSAMVEMFVSEFEAKQWRFHERILCCQALRRLTSCWSVGLLMKLALRRR